MGTQKFDNWYLKWSTYACRAQVDDTTKMFAFRKAINPMLHAKIIQLSPQLTTLVGLIEKARELDSTWHTFCDTSQGSGCQGARVREVTSDNTNTAEINATLTCRPQTKR